MKPVCNTCNDAELVATTKAFRFGLRILNNLVKKEREYVCPSCGQRTTDDPFASDTPVEHTVDGDTRTGDVRRRQVMLDNLSADRKDFMSVQFPATYQVGQNVLWPTFEGNVQDGTVIDRHGDPDLMLEMAEQYFKLYNATMTAGRLPSSLVEVLSALHLLVTAAELGFKACLTRDGKDPAGHSLQRLYEDLAPAYRDRIDTSFFESYLNANLTALGKRVRQRTIRALGRKDVLQASGELDRLIASLARHSERAPVDDGNDTVAPFLVRRGPLDSRMYKSREKSLRLAIPSLSPPPGRRPSRLGRR